jgi:hypothetical protein
MGQGICQGSLVGKKANFTLVFIFLELPFKAIAREWNAEELPTLSKKGHWHGKTLSRLI